MQSVELYKMTSAPEIVIELQEALEKAEMAPPYKTLAQAFITDITQSLELLNYIARQP